MSNLISISNPKMIECGSFSEGGYYARSYFHAIEGKTEKDELYVFGELFDENLLNDCTDCSLFVKVLWNCNLNPGLPFGKFNKSDNVQYINGFECKELIAKIYYPSYIKRKHLKFDKIETQTVELMEPISLSQANIYYHTSYQINNLNELLNKYDTNIYQKLFVPMTLERRESFRQLFQAQDRQDDVWEFRYHMTNNKNVKGMYKLWNTMLSPVFGLPVPHHLLKKLHVLHEFYRKYKFLVSISMKSGDKYDVFEKDIVPAIELKFWPKVMNWFINRMETSSRWEKVYKEKMQNQPAVYLVSKWSGKGSIFEAQYQFRYSFSLIELILARERTPYENQFNFMVKLLYYKYLRPIETSTGQYIQSYFIKTTVAWILEVGDLEQIWDHLNQIRSQNKIEQEHSKINNCTLLICCLLNSWSDMVMNMFKTRHCKHYFIQNVNILENYDEDLLDLAYGVLLSLKMDETTSLVESTFHLFEACLNVNDLYRIRHGKSSKAIIEIKTSATAADEFRQLVCNYFDDSPLLLKYNEEYMNIVLESFHFIELRYPNLLTKWYSIQEEEEEDQKNMLLPTKSECNPAEFSCLISNVIETSVNRLIPNLLDFGDLGLVNMDALCIILDAISADKLKDNTFNQTDSITTDNN